MHLPIAAAGVALVIGAFAGPASADPNGAKGAFPGTANCGSAGSFNFVTNSANGGGSGTNNGTQAPWTPAHLSPGNGVFHPTAFDLTFTFTPASGPSESFTNDSVRANQAGTIVCNISGSRTDAAGDTSSLSGTVTGWIS